MRDPLRPFLRGRTKVENDPSSTCREMEPTLPHLHAFDDCERDGEPRVAAERERLLLEPGGSGKGAALGGQGAGGVVAHISCQLPVPSCQWPSRAPNSKLETGNWKLAT